MKCIVLSDSHGEYGYIMKALLKNRDADAVFFLGDGLSDFDDAIDRFPLFSQFKVKGNCDYGYSMIDPSVSKTGEVTLEGKKIVYTHGDLYNAKSTTADLTALAMQRGADIVLFGHTHYPLDIYVPTDSEEYKLVFRELKEKGLLPDGFLEKPIRLFNPGSISYRDGVPSFGILTITDTAVLTSHGSIL